MGFYETTKDLVKLIQQIDNVDILKKVLQLQTELIEVTEKTKDLKEENSDLKQKLKMKELLRYENNLYWAIEVDGQKNGPYCPRCWDKDKNLIHMLKDNHYYRCPDCKCTVQHTKMEVTRGVINKGFMEW